MRQAECMPGPSSEPQGCPRPLDTQVQFLSASEAINASPHEYNALMLDIARSLQPAAHPALHPDHGPRRDRRPERCPDPVPVHAVRRHLLPQGGGHAPADRSLPACRAVAALHALRGHLPPQDVGRQARRQAASGQPDCEAVAGGRVQCCCQLRCPARSGKVSCKSGAWSTSSNASSCILV